MNVKKTEFNDHLKTMDAIQASLIGLNGHSIIPVIVNTFVHNYYICLHVLYKIYNTFWHNNSFKDGYTCQNF